MDKNAMTFLANQLVWISISFTISIGLALLFPFYISLPLTIVIFIGLGFYMRKRIIQGKRMPMMNPKAFSQKIQFYCLSCGHKHSKRECPKCGSKMRKTG